MKPSIYNNVVPIGVDKILIYNSFTDSFTMLERGVFSAFQKCSKDLARFQAVHPDAYEKLCKCGCVVKDDFQELEYIQNLRLLRRFSCKEYNLILNTCMDCNMSCWYCYESHIKDSYMSIGMADKIIRHIKTFHKETRFEKLHLEFFGGEPILNFATIKYILSQISPYVKENNIFLETAITTNATCLTEDMLNFLKDFRVLFQITLDGGKERHDRIRYFKATNEGSYETILQTLRRIQCIMREYVLRLRINFDAVTFHTLNTVLDDIDFIERNKTVIGLHKVWQVAEKNIPDTDVYDFIEECNNKGFCVSFTPFGSAGYKCYADNYCQAVVNYDGNVFKYTARDFHAEDRDGYLNDDGHIIWNTGKLMQRLSTATPEICLGCKLYPTCLGACSQCILEQPQGKCYFNDATNINDLILIHLNQTRFQLKSK